MTEKQTIWFKKITSWIPDWFYQDRELETSFLKALAKILESSQVELEDQLAMTFVDKSVSGYLEMHGSERSVFRNSNEFDSSFRQRIKTTATSSNANLISLKTLIDKLLINGKAQIKEDFNNDLFFGRGEYFNRGAITFDEIINTFTVVFDNQNHSPYSFFGRESFCNRENFIGQNESSIQFFNLILNTINENKALGTLFRIVERV